MCMREKEKENIYVQAHTLIIIISFDACSQELPQWDGHGRRASISLSKHTLLACSRSLNNLSHLSLTYSHTLSLHHFTGGRPLSFPLYLTYTPLVILLSSIRSMWPNHFNVCLYLSPLDSLEKAHTHFITRSIHSTYTTSTSHITHFHCLHSRPLTLILKLILKFHFYM